MAAEVAVGPPGWFYCWDNCSLIMPCSCTEHLQKFCTTDNCASLEQLVFWSYGHFELCNWMKGSCHCVGCLKIQKLTRSQCTFCELLLSQFIIFSTLSFPLAGYSIAFISCTVYISIFGIEEIEENIRVNQSWLQIIKINFWDKIRMGPDNLIWGRLFDFLFLHHNYMYTFLFLFY